MLMRLGLVGYAELTLRRIISRSEISGLSS